MPRGRKTKKEAPTAVVIDPVKDEDHDGGVEASSLKEGKGPLRDKRRRRRCEEGVKHGRNRLWPEGVEIKDFRVWISMVTRTKVGMERRTRCIGEAMARGGRGCHVRSGGGPEHAEETARMKVLQAEVELIFATALMELEDEAVRIELGPRVPPPSQENGWIPLPPNNQDDDLNLLETLSILDRTYRRRRREAWVSEGRMYLSKRELNYDSLPLEEGSKLKSMTLAEEVSYWLGLVNGNSPPPPSVHEELEAIQHEALTSKAVLDSYKTSIEELRSRWIQEDAEDHSAELRRMELVSKFEEMKANILKEKPRLIEEARRGLEERRQVLSKETMEERVTRISKIYQETEVETIKQRKRILDGKNKKKASDKEIQSQDEEAKKRKTKLAASAYNMMTQKMELVEYKLFISLLPLLGVGLVPDDKYGPHIHVKQPPRYLGLRFPPKLDTIAEAEFDLWLSEESSVSSIENWSQRKPHLRTPEGVWAYRKLLAEFVKRKKQQLCVNVKSLRDLIIKHGHDILRHLTYKRFYYQDMLKPNLLVGGKYYEKAKAYKRKVYGRKKHGITMELGEYLSDRLPGTRVYKGPKTNDGLPKAGPRGRPPGKRGGPSSVSKKAKTDQKRKSTPPSKVTTRSQRNSQPEEKSDEDESHIHDDDCDTDFDIDSLLDPLPLPPQSDPEEMLHDQPCVEDGNSHVTIPFSQRDSHIQHLSPTTHSFPNQGNYHHQSNYRHPPQIENIARHPASSLSSTSFYPYHNRTIESSPHFLQDNMGSPSRYDGSSFPILSSEPLRAASSPSASQKSAQDDDEDWEPQIQQCSSVSSKSKRGRPRGSKNMQIRTRRTDDSATNQTTTSIQHQSRDIWNNRKRRKLHHHHHNQATLVADDKANSTDPTSTTILPISSLVSRAHENSTVCLICGHEEKDPKMLEKHLSASHPVKSSHDEEEAQVVCPENIAAHIQTQDTETQQTVAVINVLKTDEAIEEVPDSNSNAEDEETQKSSPCKCQLCGTSVDNPYKLIAHVLRAHLFKSTCHKCPFQPCTGSSASLTTLKIHIGKNHHSRSKNSFIFGVHTSKMFWDRAQEFHCIYCSLGFENREGMEQHYKDFHEKRRYSCPRCGLLLKMESHLIFHMKLFHSESIGNNISPFAVNLQESDSSKKCKICHCEFLSNCFLLQHLKTGHNVSEMVSSPEDMALKPHCEEGCKKTHDHLCCYCGEEFADMKGLQTHISSSEAHVSAKDTSSESSPFPAVSDPFKCELCSNSFSDFYILLWHSLALHGLGPAILTRQSQGGGVWDENVEFEHDIPVEKAETDVLIAAAAASRSKDSSSLSSSLPPLPCWKCGEEDTGLSSSTFHEGHAKYNSLIVKTCKSCDKIYSRGSNLRQHLEAHHRIPRQDLDKVRPYPLVGKKALPDAESADNFVQCPQCKVFFSQEEFHKIHTLLRKDPDVRKCPECNLTFTNSEKCQQHLHAVHGLKVNSKMRATQNHEAAETGMTIDESNVDSCFVHSTVEGISVYSCKVCSNRHFKTRDFVVKHIVESHETYQRKFHCDQCNFSAAGRGAIVAHTKIHHSNDLTLYQCPFCSMSSQYDKCVTRHVDKVHGDMEKGIFSKSMIQAVKKTFSELKEENKGKELCSICHNFFRNKKVLKGHLAKQHGIVSKDSTWCEVCGLHLTLGKFQDHVRRTHPEAPLPDTSVPPQPKSAVFPVIKLIQEVMGIYKEMEKELVPFDSVIRKELKLKLRPPPGSRKKRSKGASSASTAEKKTQKMEADAEDSDEDRQIVEMSTRKLLKRKSQGKKNKKHQAKRRKKDPPVPKKKKENVPLRRSTRNRNNPAVVKSSDDDKELKVDDSDDDDDFPSIKIKIEEENISEDEDYFDNDYMPFQLQPDQGDEDEVEVKLPLDLDHTTLVNPLESGDDDDDDDDALVEKMQQKNQQSQRKKLKVKKLERHWKRKKDFA